ncbi:WD domain, G-beta repeat [Aquisphaera giovannonii]|uniref:WD domain, G-beta repeat n=1 Tax=Aquisphaera giovannonii TaxID=406548 RepID=A0A5B9VW11_9BACT|nr:hypothetical protein [Aquisphaera giovannonii]QEH32543.1 WD domain, G-beta repeat [Aquisphaera giovannonii]
MSEVICQVTNHADRVELVWSSRGGFFRPYAIAGAELAELRDAAARARKALEVLVHALNTAGPQPMPWEPAFKVVEAGFELYNRLLPGGEDTARSVRNWLVDLRDRSGSLGLEVVVEELSEDPASYLSVPWNLVYDDYPEDHEAEFRAGRGAERWRPFWAIRYALTTGRRVEPLRRSPSWEAPRVIAVIDPSVRANLKEEQRDELDRFLAEARLTPVGSLKDLRAELRKGYPRLLYWLGHATPEYLRLGDAEKVRPADLRNLLSSYASREKPEGMLAFLNACQTAESGSGGSFLDVLHHFGFAGAIATERQTIDNFANEFGLAFLRGFLRDGKPLGQLLHELRLERAPLGLLYGAHCPPEIRVAPGAEPPCEPMAIREDVQAAGALLGAATLPEAGPDAGLVPRLAAKGDSATDPAVLPGRPYPSLGFYDEGDRALFTGRDADVVRFAATLDRPDTRVLILHAESGVGKSSFLRAGVIPYLEGECSGYRFFRRADGSLLILSTAKDLVGQFARALLDLSETPLRFEAPAGGPLEVDLRPVIDEAIGAKADYARLRESLASDPNLLAAILARMAGRLPHALVLVLDQAEEVFTLARTKQDEANRDQALRMIQGLVDVRADVKLIVALRTEYYGRLLDHLREGRRDLVGVRDDLLRDFSRPALIEAIKRPTREPSYGFRYAEGIPERIADAVLDLRRDHQDGILPLVQVICTQLYEREKEDTVSAGVVTEDDLNAIRGVEGGLRAFAEDALRRVMSLSAEDRRAFKDLYGRLCNRQPDGTLTTSLHLRDGLAARWARPTSFDEVLEKAVRVRLLREDEIRIEGEKPLRYIRLGHDALARVAAEWGQEGARRARFRRLVLATAGSLTLAAAMLSLALFAFQQAGTARRSQQFAEDSRRLADARSRAFQMTSAALAFDRGSKLCEGGEVDRGLLWLARSLKLTPPDEKGLRRVTLANLAAWQSRLTPLEAIFRHDGGVRAVAFSPDGATALTGGFDKTARLWDVATGLPRGKPLEHPDTVSAVAYRPDGEYLATCCQDGEIRLWDAGTGERASAWTPIKHQENFTNTVTFSWDNSLMVTTSYNEEVRSWHAATGQPLDKRIKPEGHVTSAALSRDGKWLLLGYAERKAQLWDLEAAQPRPVQGLNHSEVVSAVAFSPDSRACATGGYDSAVRIWDVATGSLVREIIQPRSAVVAVAFSPDGRLILSGHLDGYARLWDATTGRPRGAPIRHQTWVPAVAFRPDGSQILTGSGDKTARIWNLQIVDGEKVFDHGDWVRSAAISPDGRSMVTGGSDKSVRIWDTTSGSLRGSPLKFDDEVNIVAFDPGGDRFLAGGSDKSIRIWDASTRSPIGPPLRHGTAVMSGAFSPDGKYVATGTVGGKAHLWDVAQGRGVAEPASLASQVWGIAFHPSGGSFATADYSGVVQVWDVGTLRPIGPPLRHPISVFSVAYNRDGSILATACDDGYARLWDVATARPIGTPIQHPCSVWSVAFSPDGETLLTGDQNGSARLWDIATGKPVGPPFRHEATVCSVAYRRDGKAVLTGSWDRTARIWPVARHSLKDDQAGIELWTRALTGLELEDKGTYRVLEVQEWQQVRSDLKARWGTLPGREALESAEPTQASRGGP